MKRCPKTFSHNCNSFVLFVCLFVFFMLRLELQPLVSREKKPYTLENQVVSIIISKRILIYGSAGFLIGEKCRVLHRNSWSSENGVTLAFGQSWRKGTTYQVSHNCFNILVIEQVWIYLRSLLCSIAYISFIHPSRNVGKWLMESFGLPIWLTNFCYRRRRNKGRIQ